SLRFAQIDDPRPLSLAEARRALDSGTVLLSYLVGREKTILFVVEPAGVPRAPGGVRTLEIPLGREALRERVSAFLALLQNAGPASAELCAAASDLYQLLVAPASDILAAHERILVSPDGPLQGLPFAALRRSEHA